MTTRRDILRNAALFSGAGLLSSALPGFSALAQAGGGYKALVCVFLDGGMDGHDTLIPYDADGYAQWAGVREGLLARYAEAGDDSRQRERLLPIGTQADGRALALPRQMAEIADAYAAGDAAFVANVGPLVAPMTAADADAERVPLPPRLMSHNDQESVWQSQFPEGAPSGWGGRMIDALAARRSPFSAISVSGNPIFLAGEASQPFVVDRNGARRVHGTQTGWAYGSRDVPAALEAHYAASAAEMDSWIASDLQAARRENLGAANELHAMTRDSAVGDEIRIEDNKLSEQLAAVAKIIDLRDRLGLERQVFFVRLGSFDTHDDQAERLPVLHARLSAALGAFHAWADRTGLGQSVTSFTASDFGRTLTVNATGTDHGWGGHHLVMGGAVRGGRIVGAVPPSAEGHAQDFGRGRMIPTLASVQYAASLGRWFGLSGGQLADVLPGLGAFDADGAALF